MTQDPTTPNLALARISDDDQPRAIVPRNFEQAIAFADAISKSSLVPDKLRAKAPDVLMIVLAGAELGIAPIASLRMFHVIEGQPKLSSSGLAAICISSPLCEYLRRIEYLDDRVTWEGKRRGDPAQRVTFTIADAKRANLLGKANWISYPKDMMSARASANLCRSLWPELAAGLYVAEEDDATTAEPVGGVSSGFTAPPASTAPPAKGKAKPAKGASVPPPSSGPANDDIVDAEIVDGPPAGAADANPTPSASSSAGSAPSSSPEGTATSPDTSPSAKPSSPGSAATVPSETPSSSASSPGTTPSPSTASVPAAPPPAAGTAADPAAGDEWGELAPIDRFRAAVAAAGSLEALDAVKGVWLDWSKSAEGKPHAPAMREAFAKRKAALS